MTLFDPNVVKIGISSCLLGEEVRFDGGHKRSHLCVQEVGQVVDFVSVCPEMAIGMGTPRPAIRLIKDGEDIYLQSRDGSLDVTQKMNQFSAEKVDELDYLSGYIVCAKSPSCGMERVLEYKKGTNNSSKSGIGIFTRRLMEIYPHLPVEEDGRLHDLLIRENFFTRVFAYHDWKTLSHSGFSKHKLTDFHARYKYLLMSHSPKAYQALGQTLGNIDDVEKTAQLYFEGFMTALKTKATKKNHTNTLQHIQGYFKKHLTPEQKAELTDAIMKFHDGVVPLLVPITLINHYLKEYPMPYIEQQVYLNPHPELLKLRYAY
jgi:uncharacterized protein YbgA (DUF1722 family)/uncharacterized protein YbbK (DUF523 family)